MRKAVKGVAMDLKALEDVVVVIGAYNSWSRSRSD